MHYFRVFIAELFPHSALAQPTLKASLTLEQNIASLPEVEDNFLSVSGLGQREGSLQLLLRNVQEPVLHVHLGDVDVGEEGGALLGLKVGDCDHYAFSRTQVGARAIKKGFMRIAANFTFFPLKGQCHKIFCFWFFHESSSPKT